MDFTCCWKTQPCPTRLHTQAFFPILQSPARGAGNRALPRGTICSCQHLPWAPPVTAAEERGVLDELLERSVWSPPSSLLATTGLLGSRGRICVLPLRPHLYQLEVSHWELVAVSRDPRHFLVTSVLLLLQKFRKQLKF